MIFKSLVYSIMKSEVKATHNHDFLQKIAVEIVVHV